ncbi:DUF3631 domain-containing protein [Mycobacterium conspicuum]|jgi:hypothetical protein|uniref:DUF3631 domain-containing protein n=1 Tax=Mycobacterium conspicuum TaxID=44010 RepID=A0A7I7YAJ5_9MYCO|nr:DUF3631 domain-containing protein [Mycobacterium conspicuum]BBZ38729.1 hypothetical protein MCNS_17920 [Mycobacterium conspicuum]
MNDSETLRQQALDAVARHCTNGAAVHSEPPWPADDPGPAEPAALPEPEPEPDDGARLLNDIRSFLARFVIYPTQHALDAHTLWIAHAWLTDAFESTPRIAFLSPEPGSGKSRALEVTEPLVPHPVHAVNTTPAYLFRKVAERGDDGRRPTILYDEIDTVFGPKAKDNEDIRGMLNAGHRKGAVAGRCTVRGGLVKTEEIDAYCAVALAGLDDLPDTIMTRSVVIRMKRRAPSEPVEPWRHRINRPEAAALAARLANWAANVTADVTDRWPEMPPSVTDRAADVWEALLIVADQAGGHWPESARVAAVTAVTELSNARQSLGVMLLRDVRTVFDQTGATRFVTDQLITNLKEIDEGVWAVIRKGEPIDARRLASLLRKYGIEPKPQRDGDRVFKGYARSQFEDAWARYLPPESSVTPVTQSTDAELCTDCGTGLEHVDSIAAGRCAECQLTRGAQ